MSREGDRLNVTFKGGIANWGGTELWQGALGGGDMMQASEEVDGKEEHNPSIANNVPTWQHQSLQSKPLPLLVGGKASGNF